MNKLKINREGKSKLIASLSLVVYAFVVTLISKNVGAIIVMILSFFGDVCIMAKRGALTGKKENTFDLGVMFFGFAHLGYIITMGHRPVCIIIATIACIFICILMKVKPNSKLIYIPYAIVLFTCAINAWFFLYIAGIGMILFLLSDGVLSLFEDKAPGYQILIWVLYVPAQYLMLTSILIFYK